jgi:hypothetical protein
MLNIVFTCIKMYSLVSFIDNPFNVKIVVGFRLVHSVLLLENEFNCGKFCV